MEMVDKEAGKIVDEAERDIVTFPSDVLKYERSLFQRHLIVSTNIGAAQS